jgi:proline iminopeptidase
MSFVRVRSRFDRVMPLDYTDSILYQRYIPEGGMNGFIEINGQAQWIGVHGDDGAKPLLLFLHGGPGSAMSLLHHAHFRPLEADFTVVHWDQRGSGRSFGRLGKRTGPLSIELLVEDGVAVAEHLRTRFPGRALVVLGASWGSLLGAEMVRRRPELFDAFVGTGQVVDMAGGEQLSYRAAIERSLQRGKPRLAEKLERGGPPPYLSLKALIVQRRALLAGTPAAERKLAGGFLLTMLKAPGAWPWDVVDVLRGTLYTISRLWVALSGWRLEDGGLSFGMPVLFLQGVEDMQTPTPLVEEVFPKLRAPQKQLVLIPGAGHLAIATHLDRCIAEIRAHILPGLSRKAAA